MLLFKHVVSLFLHAQFAYGISQKDKDRAYIDQSVEVFGTVLDIIGDLWHLVL